MREASESINKQRGLPQDTKSEWSWRDAGKYSYAEMAKELDNSP